MTGYVDDVPYVRYFTPDLAPARLRLVAALNGVEPPPARDFDYCELGCGHGDTLAALAAAHPDGRFLGVDIVPAHVTSAKKLAREGGLENFGVLEADFGKLLGEDIGTFDYITAHGVLSWISPEKRAQMLAFACAKLKPGGLFHVSYNAMPGWSAVEPLRQLLLFGGTIEPKPNETSLERATRGVLLAQSMEAAKSEYFTRNPSSSEMLAAMTRAGLSYVVHEYLHENWTPMYFARIAWEMAQSNLRFVGVLPAHLNFRDAAVDEEHERLFAKVTDRVAFESLKDYALNEFFRRDVYVKGEVPRSTETTHRYLETTPWGETEPNREASARLPHRTLSLEGAAFDELRRAFDRGSVVLGNLREDLRQALLRLVLAERVAPLLTTTRHAAVEGGAMFEMPSPYNQAMLRRLSSDVPLVMTSPVAGTAFTISALEGLSLRMLVEVPPEARRTWVRDLVGRSVLRVRIGDRVIADRDEQERAIHDAFERLVAARLPKMVELGIVRPRGT